MTLPVAILAGGLARRLRPLSETIPKALIDIDGKPFAVHQIDLLRRHGLTQIVLCVGYLGEQVQTALGEGSQLGVHIEYSFDGPRLLGTGGALRNAMPHLGESFFVLYGDSYLDCDYASVEAAYRTCGVLGLMTVYRNADRWDRSNILFSDGVVRGYDKDHPSADMEHIDYGLGVLSRPALEPYLADAPLDLATVYQDLLAQGQLAGYEVGTRFYEIGSESGLEELRQHLTRKAGMNS
jgi:NDP-sugar pyrophosphorylase family protein